MKENERFLKNIQLCLLGEIIENLSFKMSNFQLCRQTCTTSVFEHLYHHVLQMFLHHPITDDTDISLSFVLKSQTYQTRAHTKSRE